MDLLILEDSSIDAMMDVLINSEDILLWGHGNFDGKIKGLASAQVKAGGTNEKNIKQAKKRAINVFFFCFIKVKRILFFSFYFIVFF
jgi:hypothetical protein